MDMSEQKKDDGDSSTIWLVLLGVVVIGFAALPVAFLMWPFAALAKRKQAAMGGAALAGLTVFVLLCLAPFKAEFAELKDDKQAKDWSAVMGHAPQFWLLTLPLAPLAGMSWELFRPRSVAEKQEEQERLAAEKADRKERQGWRKAERDQSKASDAAIGTIKAMSQPLPDFLRAGNALQLKLDGSSANLHSLVLGGSGAGKTETLKRLVSIYATQTDYDIFLIDPKNDRELKIAFLGLVGMAGRRCRVFPDEPYNGFRGDARALHNRFLTIPKLGTEGASAYFAEMSEEYLWLGINAGDGVPRSFGELAQRLDYDGMTAYYQGDPASLQSLQRIKKGDANSIAMRFSNIARKLDQFSANGWALEDTRAGYFGLPVLENARDVDAVARYLIEDFKHYFATRKTSRRTVVLIDEFSALGSENVVNLMELVRALGGIVILASQTTAALGDERLQQRILGNVTIYLQRMNDPREVAILGGMQQRLDVSRRMGAGGMLDQAQGIARYVEKAVIDPTKAAQLPIGGAFLINRGYVAEVKIVQAPPIEWTMVNQLTALLSMQIQGLIQPVRKATEPQTPRLVTQSTPKPTAVLSVAQATLEPEELRLDVARTIKGTEQTRLPLDDDFI
jgi:hypothetical protein